MAWLSRLRLGKRLTRRSPASSLFTSPATCCCEALESRRLLAAAILINESLTLTEGQSGSVHVTFWIPTSQPLTLFWHVEDASAVRPDDYELPGHGYPQTHFSTYFPPPGPPNYMVTTGFDIPVQALADNLVEPLPETFRLVLDPDPKSLDGDPSTIPDYEIRHPNPYYTGNPAVSTVTILDDPAKVSIICLSGSASEGSPLTFQVSRSGGALDQALGVGLQSPSGTATPGADYGGVPGSVTIPADQWSVTFSVTTVADGDNNETDESVEIALAASPAYTFASPATTKATGVITGRNGFFDLGRQGEDISWWVDPNAGGGRGRQGIGSIQKETAPVIETGTGADGLAWARVKLATGEVIVDRSFTGQKPGDQGTDAAGRRVYISPQLASDLDKHEQGHVDATEAIFSRTLQLALNKAAQYRSSPMVGAAGETEATVRARLEAEIGWLNRRQAFIDKEALVNSANGTFHVWETAQGGGPTDMHPGPGVIGGTPYGLIYRSREETDPNYDLPNYSTFDPWAP